MNLVLSPRFTPDSQHVMRAAHTRGWNVHRLQGWRTEHIEDVGAIYGETLWARVVASQVGCELIEPPLDWLVNVPEELRRRKVWFGTPDTLPAIRFPAFMKPADDKTFEARVYDTMPEIPAGVPILVSEVMPIDYEFRVWVLDGEAVAASPYVVRDAYKVWSIEAMDFAEQCAKSPHTPPALVIDVAFHGGQWAVIEANPCFGSGIYDADPDKVLDVLAAACVKEAPPQFVQEARIDA